MAIEKYKDKSFSSDHKDLIIKQIRSDLRKKLSKEERLLLEMKRKELEENGTPITPEVEQDVIRYFAIRQMLGVGIKGDDRNHLMREYYNIKERLRL